MGAAAAAALLLEADEREPTRRKNFVLPTMAFESMRPCLAPRQ